MKKLILIPVFTVLLFLLCFNFLYMPGVNKDNFQTPLYSDTIPTYEISGWVYYKESVQPVEAGYVKAVRFDWQKDKLVTVDSAAIGANGSFTLPRCPVDSLYIMAYGDDELLDFTPGYHDTTIHWQNSVIITPSANISNANINVNRIIAQENGTHHISGKILKDPNKPNDAIEDAIIYAKVGPKFKGYGISDKFGNYNIDSLPPGDFEIIAERIGYYKDYRYIQIGQFNTDTINFYLSRVASVDPPGKQIPKEFVLYNNYPNPFNPGTKIKLSIPPSKGARGMMIRLIVYNILGREITALINQQLLPGTYEVEWNGTNYPSGIYFYKLIVTDLSAGSGESFVETKKMVLIK